MSTDVVLVKEKSSLRGSCEPSLQLNVTQVKMRSAGCQEVCLSEFAKGFVLSRLSEL